MKKIIFLCFCLLLCFLMARAYANCNLFWSLREIPRVRDIDINATGEKEYFNTNFDIMVGGRYILKDVKADTFWIPGIAMSGNVRYWIQYSNEWVEIPGGLKYRVSSNLQLPDAFQIPKYRTVVTPLQKAEWMWEGQLCPPEGSDYLFGPQKITGMSLDVDSTLAYPGVYNIPLDIRVAYEENKGGRIIDDGWKNYPSLILQEPQLRSNIKVYVNNACTFPEKKLDVDFGNITDKEVLKGTEKIVKFPMNCSRQVSFIMKLEGGNKGKNITSCGNGTCTLTFDNGLDEISALRSSGYNETNIHVNMKSDRAFTGIFNGSMILKIFIN